ncbi:DUF305 domain-containing protein [Streptomyces sp. N2-109]|uniref:DUF305 domain-containing protein n=1 Tax=Streptomyces gossypii TaxID=2883101 RepID=A0ABT2JV36_9ACTN|nr:DUF305 domain-containing protein [Streptomyces gossypii]MCT2591611.1 DUF305 domain-containing protein [Streptomyces gossypii]
MSGDLRRWWPAALSTFVALWLAVLTLVVVRTEPWRSEHPGKESVDAGFARDMAVHHQQAVEMSFLVRDSTGDESVRRLAYDIINTQANQRGMLLARLDEWKLPKTSREPPMAWMGHEMDHAAHGGFRMPGMATDAQLDELREAEGKEAEVLYLQLMSAHHHGGVDMAKAAAEQAEDRELASLAEGMVSSQRSEITLMASMLKKRGANAG